MLHSRSFVNGRSRDVQAAEQEIDDTKELQTEEALKLYQAALKHHAYTAPW